MPPGRRGLTALLLAVVMALSIVLVGGPLSTDAAAKPDPCHPAGPGVPASPDWPDCLPSEAEMTAAVRTERNRAFFWTGRIRDEAGRIARSFGGTTLEMALEDHNLRMPDILEPTSDEGTRAWVHASRELARQASGIVYVVLGRPENIRPGNVWETEERGRVMANPDVTAIIEIIEQTGDERVYWRRDTVSEQSIAAERARMHARRVCTVWQQAGWPATSSTTTSTEIPARTLSPTRPDEVLIGGSSNPHDGWRTTSRYYGIIPTHTMPPSQRQVHAESTPLLEAVFEPRATRPSYLYLHMNTWSAAVDRFTPERLGCQEGDGGHDPDNLKKRDIRLMPLGDSITYGVESSDRTGYRDELYDYLEADARSVDFVGSVRAGSMSDPDNEGHPGDRIDEIAPFAACHVKRYQPNVITLHAGTNDMNQDYQLASAPDRLKKLINRALTDSPEATVLVARLIPTAKAGLQPRIDAYNAALPAMVKDLQREGKHVVLVDMGQVSVSDGLENDAHPTDEGYAKMADAWHRGLMEADAEGWIQPPLPQKTGEDCDSVGTGDPGGSGTAPGETALGEGWRKLGVIAPGYGGEPGRTVIAELNGDQRADYLQVRDSGNFRASANTVGTPGQPDWVELGTYGPGGLVPGNQVRFADLDGDGRDDYLVVSSDSEIQAYLNKPGENGKLRFVPAGTVFDEESFSRDNLRFADLTGDGKDDILRVGAEGAVHVYRNEWSPSDPNTGSGPRPVSWPLWLNWAGGTKGSSLAAVRFADVDADRRADYLQVGAEGAVHAFLNRGGGGNGSFEAHHLWARESNYPRKYVQFADISGDGKADYLVVYEGGAVRAWLNRGGNLQPPTGPSTGSGEPQPPTGPSTGSGEPPQG
ncbi:FG-GAP-like repeat-containing protein [Streptomyces sp. NPDC002888]|uniref:FG-GAP-like repeat-containing protein n=1 Tax=Streptomyces sp. NPDC002888 TaxID=3364668 RepID=UPI003696488D